LRERASIKFAKPLAFSERILYTAVIVFLHVEQSMRGYVTRITLSNTQTTEQLYGNSRIELATAWRKCSFYDTATDD